jgi:hypothetical protein
LDSMLLFDYDIVKKIKIAYLFLRNLSEEPFI